MGKEKIKISQLSQVRQDGMVERVGRVRVELGEYVQITVYEILK